jgi:hypothetical protein
MEYGINSPATNRQRLIKVATITLEMLHSEDISPAFIEALPSSDPQQGKISRDIISNSLSSALDWARMEQQTSQLAEESTESSSMFEPYIPSNQALSLVQSAYDEYTKAKIAKGQEITETPFDPFDPGWAKIAFEKLKALVRGKHPFIKHSSPSSFRYNLPPNAVVALFGDWGTGEPTAKRVMDQIRLKQPTHAIHLGDIYYSGTPNEVKERFLNIIADHGPSPSSCKYFSLNGNHDMYSGGYGYFDSVLAQFGQDASYFNLRNDNWQLIGLDSAYEEYGLQAPQSDWLTAQLAEQNHKSILMSHHQLFSPYESRAANRTLLRKTQPLLPQVYAWFWGHEHKCIVMEDNMGIKPRCIGHGAIPSKVPYGVPPFPEVPIAKVDERSAPPPDRGAIHGFALLRFAGSKLDVSYVDEFGGEFFAEQFNT